MLLLLLLLLVLLGLRGRLRQGCVGARRVPLLPPRRRTCPRGSSGATPDHRDGALLLLLLLLWLLLWLLLLLLVLGTAGRTAPRGAVLCAAVQPHQQAVKRLRQRDVAAEDVWGERRQPRAAQRGAVLAPQHEHHRARRASGRLHKHVSVVPSLLFLDQVLGVERCHAPRLRGHLSQEAQGRREAPGEDWMGAADRSFTAASFVVEALVAALFPQPIETSSCRKTRNSNARAE